MTLSKDLLSTLETVMKRVPEIKETPMDDREGTPVTAIVIDGMFYLYPCQKERLGLGNRKFDETHYAVDVAVGSGIVTGGPDDDTDYAEIGMYPTPSEAIAAVVAEFARDEANRAMEITEFARALNEE